MMTLTIKNYLNDPERFQARLQALPSCEALRFEIFQNVTASDFQSIALSLERFLDLTLCIKDLTDHRWDLDFISLFPHVRSLQIKCLWSLTSLEAISKLHHLQDLELGSILNRSRDLSPLLSFPKLKSLSLAGDWHSLFLLENLQTLEKLTFVGCPEKNITWMAGLPLLRELQMMDGKLENFEGWSSSSIQKISLLKMRHLQDLRGLENFSSLQELTLKSLPRLQYLPSQYFLDHLHTFRAVHIRSAGVEESIDQNRDDELQFSF